MDDAQLVKLTSLSSCAGCAAKLGQSLLSQVIHRLPHTDDANVLVGAGTFDDAGVYRIGRNRALVQTIDFFTPIVDDPYEYGQIAAANAISDVYAMGGRPITAMNVLGVPTDRMPLSAVGEILRGGAAKAKEADVALLGGHTIRIPEPVYGLSVTGIVDPRKMLTNAAACAGDILVLTKPLGTGIATTGIKRGLASGSLAKKAVNSMRRLNTVGADLAERRLVKAATDVTGFGLLGHLASMCRASGVGAALVARDVPVLADEVFHLIEQDCVPGGSQTNRQTAEPLMKWNDTPEAYRVLLADAQTSGGLLLCVPERNIAASLALLKKAKTLCAAVIGRIVASRRPRISVHFF